MKNKKWKEFGKLTGKCYVAMGQGAESRECWDQAFEVLKEIVADAKAEEAEYAQELFLLDEETDYEYDVQGWLEDYLDELDMGEDKECLLKVCDELIGMFSWEEDKPSDIKFLKASALGSLGRKEEAAEFCKTWLEEETDDLTATAASIYALIAVHDMETPEKLIKQHIHENTECTDENDILFEAAIAYYKAAGNKKEVKRLDKARDEYDKLLGKLFLGFDENEDGGFMWDDDDLPF